MSNTSRVLFAIEVTETVRRRRIKFVRARTGQEAMRMVVRSMPHDMDKLERRNGDDDSGGQQVTRIQTKEQYENTLDR
jgi:hypothetical protein